MKIFHLITSLDDGGAEGALYRYIKFDSNFEHVVATFRGEGKYGEKLKAEGVKVEALNVSDVLSLLKGFIKLIRLLKSERPSIVQTWMYHSDLIGGLVARCLGFKVVWGIRNTVLSSETSKASTLIVAKLCAWLSYYIPDKIVACAYAARDFHISYGYDESKMIVVQNGYEFRDIQSFDLNWDGFKIGMVARFDPFKDHRNLLQALAILKKKDARWRCFLVGHQMDESNSTLMEWLKEFDLSQNIILMGQRSDVLSIMKALDLHVLSSNSEAFPNVIAEAMSVGTPCVSTDVGDARILVGDAGFIVPPRDPKSLESAIWSYMNLDADEKKKISLLAESRVKSKFSIEAQCEAYKNIYQNILSPS